MPTIRGFTAERMAEIEATTVTSGIIIGDDLILTLRNGDQINAGHVVGDQGPTGPPGPAATPIPTGGLLEFGGDVAPAGYLLCNGQAISRTVYADLFAVISTKYGAGNGLTTFNVPLRDGRVGIGLDLTQTEFDALGKAGGAKAVSLTAAQLASHNHEATVYSNGAHAHNEYGDDGSVFVTGGGTTAVLRQLGQSFLTGTAGPHDHLAEVAPTGSGDSHNNLQPFVVMNYIIKT